MKKLLSVFIVFLMSSCVTHYNKNINYNKGVFLPRQSFVKIERSMNTKICTDEKCIYGELVSMGSGSIVSKSPEGDVYILTAAHVCVNFKPLTPPLQLVSSKIKVFDIDESAFDAVVVDLNIKVDVCILKAKNIKYPALEMSKFAPYPGQKIYNIAAPGGVFAKNLIPIYEGYYSGHLSEEGYDYDLYTVQSYGGSSGSMITNKYGQLVGMIHSGPIKMSTISLSPPYAVLINFISDTVMKNCKTCIIK